ncbi:MAG: hypothetical protein ACYCZF_18215 [Anaerolineae bacterium]
MTFSELLDLDKTPSQTVATHRPAASRPATHRSAALRPATSRLATPGQPQKAGAYHQASHHDTMADTTVASNHETMTPRYHGTMTPRHHATMVPAMLKQLRQAVRRIGKEAATYRFTREEKDKLAETIFAESRVGIKTCENEIVRIAINWLLEDQRARGEISVLAQALKALQE